MLQSASGHANSTLDLTQVNDNIELDLHHTWATPDGMGKSNHRGIDFFSTPTKPIPKDVTFEMTGLHKGYVKPTIHAIEKRRMTPQRKLSSLSSPNAVVTSPKKSSSPTKYAKTREHIKSNKKLPKMTENRLSLVQKQRFHSSNIYQFACTPLEELSSEKSKSVLILKEDELHDMQPPIPIQTVGINTNTNYTVARSQQDMDSVNKEEYDEIVMLRQKLRNREKETWGQLRRTELVETSLKKMKSMYMQEKEKCKKIRDSTRTMEVEVKRLLGRIQQSDELHCRELQAEKTARISSDRKIDELNMKLIQLEKDNKVLIGKSTGESEENKILRNKLNDMMREMKYFQNITKQNELLNKEIEKMKMKETKDKETALLLLEENNNNIEDIENIDVVDDKNNDDKNNVVVVKEEKEQQQQQEEIQTETTTNKDINDQDNVVEFADIAEIAVQQVKESHLEEDNHNNMYNFHESDEQLVTIKQSDIDALNDRIKLLEADNDKLSIDYDIIKEKYEEHVGVVDRLEYDISRLESNANKQTDNYEEMEIHMKSILASRDQLKKDLICERKEKNVVARILPLWLELEKEKIRTKAKAKILYDNMIPDMGITFTESIRNDSLILGKLQVDGPASMKGMYKGQKIIRVNEIDVNSRGEYDDMVCGFKIGEIVRIEAIVSKGWSNKDNERNGDIYEIEVVGKGFDKQVQSLILDLAHKPSNNNLHVWLSEIKNIKQEWFDELNDDELFPLNKENIIDEDDN